MKALLRIGHARIIQLAAAPLLGGLISAGGYSLAAGSTHTIKACVDNGSGTLHIAARCHRGQHALTWNQQGPQGDRGAPGQPGAPAVSVWATVTQTRSLFAGQGLSVQHMSPGTYQITVTGAGCAQSSNAPVVSVSDNYPPTGQGAGAFAVAWVGDTGTNQQFTVHTGVVVNGAFTPTDHSFNIEDTCS